MRKQGEYKLSFLFLNFIKHDNSRICAVVSIRSWYSKLILTMFDRKLKKKKIQLKPFWNRHLLKWILEFHSGIRPLAQASQEFWWIFEKVREENNFRLCFYISNTFYNKLFLCPLKVQHKKKRSCIC